MLCATLRATKKIALQPMLNYTVQFYGNLSRNGIAGKVAESIAQCNWTFTEIVFVEQNHVSALGCIFGVWGLYTNGVC